MSGRESEGLVASQLFGIRTLDSSSVKWWKGLEKYL